MRHQMHSLLENDPPTVFHISFHYLSSNAHACRMSTACSPAFTRSHIAHKHANVCHKLSNLYRMLNKGGWVLQTISVNIQGIILQVLARISNSDHCAPTVNRVSNRILTVMKSQSVLRIAIGLHLHCFRLVHHCIFYFRVPIPSDRA